MKTSKHLLVGVPLLLAVGVAVGLLVYSPASDAKKKVDLGWSPEPLMTDSLAPEETATYSVVMTNLGKSSIAPTHQLEIVAEGDTAQFLTIDQPVYPEGSLQSGEEVTFAVTVSVPMDAPVGVHDGTLFLRRVLPNGKVKEEWRDEGLYAEFTFSPIPIPPDPGEAGKVTIEGIDSDGDGVRDDVQRWLAFNAYTTESAHAALTQSTRAFQAALVATTDESVIAAAHAQHDAIQCLYFVRGDQDDAAELHDYLRAEILNTRERSGKYIADQKILSGQFFESRFDDWQYKCAFDPWVMES